MSNILNPVVIVAVFKEIGTISGTASALGISMHRVRKTLAEAGVVANETHAEIMGLAEQGLNYKEIASHVGLSEATARSYMKPVKTLYNTDKPTSQACRCRKYRERKKNK